MKLRELMDEFFDETLFVVTTPDGVEHMFWNADYIGGHPDVMPELEPLLDREISDDVAVEMRQDPEARVRTMVPTVCVELLRTDEERECYGMPKCGPWRSWAVELKRTLTLTLRVTAHDEATARARAEAYVKEYGPDAAEEDSGWTVSNAAERRRE